MDRELQLKITPVLILLLTACQEKKGIEHRNLQYTVNDSMGLDSAVHRKVLPYKKELDSSMNVVLGYSTRTLRTGEPEGPLGNFVADLILKRTRAWADSTGVEEPEIALLNNGGLRTPLPKGPVRKGRIFKLMPFENTVEIMELGPGTMKELLTYMVENPQPIAGMQLRLRKDSIEEVKVQGKDLKERNYRVVTSNFLAEGGDGMSFFEKARSRTSTGIKVRRMISREIRSLQAEGDSVKAEKDGRVERIGEKTGS